MIGSVGRVMAQASRGLTPVASSDGTRERRVEPIAAAFGVRLDRRADFLVQLIAARDGLEQARERRRAEPAVAVRAYADAAGLGRAVAPVERARA